MHSKLTSLSGKLISWAGALAPFAALAKVASAQVTAGPGPSSFTAPITSINQTTGYLCYFLSWAFTFLIILAVVFVLVAAFKYLTAAGNPESIEKANKSLIYAAVAIVVGLIAKGVPAIVGTLFNVQGLNSC